MRLKSYNLMHKRKNKSGDVSTELLCKKKQILARKKSTTS